MEVGAVVPHSEVRRRGTDIARFYAICDALRFGELRAVDGIEEPTLRARASNYNRAELRATKIRVRKLIGGGLAIEKVAR
jgi:hypothetical protein